MTEQEEYLDFDVLFTRSNRPGSKLIRWALNEPVSHVAIRTSNAIIHSNFWGTHSDWENRWLDKNIVVYTIRVRLPFEETMNRLQDLMSKYTKYDWGAFLYFGYRAILSKITGQPLAGHNAWNTRDAYLCTEFATKLLLGDDSPGLISPYQLYLKLRGFPPVNDSERILH